MLTPIPGDSRSFALTLSDGLTVPLCGGLSAKRLDACERETVALRAAWRAYVGAESAQGESDAGADADSEEMVDALDRVRAAAVTWDAAMAPHVVLDIGRDVGPADVLTDLTEIVALDLPHGVVHDFYIEASRAILAAHGVATDDHGVPVPSTCLDCGALLVREESKRAGYCASCFSKAKKQTIDWEPSGGPR